jgi:tetratricopeptide (TPR) repeat protein
MRGFPLAVLAVLLAGGCAAPRPEYEPPRDEELARLAQAARTAFERGEWQQASRQHEAALRRAYGLDDPREIGNAAYNLAVSLIGEGEYERAADLLDEAGRELLRAGENLADVLVVQARLALLMGRHEQAWDAAEQALTHPQSAPEPSHAGLVWLLQGQAAAALGESELARSRLAEAESVLAQEVNGALRADIERLRGEIHLIENEAEMAGRAFDREADLWRATGRLRDVARALERAGEAYGRAGVADRAAERYFRSARSRFAQEEVEAARSLLERALELAESPSLRARIVRLGEEMGPRDHGTNGTVGL